MRGPVARGRLYGRHVIVESVEEARSLYALGFYGKPLGVDKPSGPNFDSPLLVSPLEAVYLARKGHLEVVDEEGGILSPEEVEERLLSDERLRMLYRVYEDLRERGLVVRPGMKFGADFAVYRYGPGIDHAPYLVVVRPLDEAMDPVEIVKTGRLSHSVRKTFTIATVRRDGSVRYVMFKWARI
ncbi:MAG: tRNA-intron lyase [Desulfurococcales archaeon]|nr:tRNA-intron lyase [Desulfurococcales archaeon]